MRRGLVRLGVIREREPGRRIEEISGSIIRLEEARGGVLDGEVGRGMIMKRTRRKMMRMMRMMMRGGIIVGLMGGTPRVSAVVVHQIGCLFGCSSSSDDCKSRGGCAGGITGPLGRRQRGTDGRGAIEGVLDRRAQPWPL
jgi:hypothetical protein